MAAYFEIAAHSAYEMFSKYKYLIVYLVFRFLECAFSLSLPTCTFCFQSAPYPRRRHMLIDILKLLLHILFVIYPKIKEMGGTCYFKIFIAIGRQISFEMIQFVNFLTTS